jgi:hypothetical protein
LYIIEREYLEKYANYTAVNKKKEELTNLQKARQQLLIHVLNEEAFVQEFILLLPKSQTRQ